MPVKVHPEYDIVVVGGGPAGIAATIAAARNGARTLVVEQASFLGGCLTMRLPINVYYTISGLRISEGIAQEFFERIRELEGTPGHIDTQGSFLRTFSQVDPEIVKYVAQEMVLESGAEILLHAFATEAVMDGNRIRGIVIHGKGGMEVIPARMVVDCSGDADIAASAGAPFQKGRESDGQMQAVTLMFGMAHVDMDRMPEHFSGGTTFAVKPGSTEPSFLRGVGNFDRWAEPIKAEGVLEVPNRAIFATSVRDGELNMNTTRIAGIDATDTWDLTRAEIEGRRQVMAMHGFFKRHVSGFEKSAVIGTGPFIGVRETRRIKGEYTLTGEDVIEGRDFSDNIGRGCYPIDIHNPDGSGIQQQFVKGGGSYGIPYRTLVGHLT